MIGFARKSATSLRGRGCIPSIPGNLSVRRFFDAFVTSSCVTDIKIAVEAVSIVL